MDPTTWMAFALAYTVLAAAPGPVVLLVVSYALGYGRRSAFAVVAGTALGDAICMIAAASGAGAVLSASATAFLVLKLAGAAYLVFMGLRLWRAPPMAQVGVSPAARSLPRVFSQAFLTSVFNPKAILFFVVFIPQFLDARAALLPQLGMMFVTVLVCGAMVDSGYTLFAAGARRFIRGERAQRAVNRTAGGVLMGEGVLAVAWRALAL